MHQTHTYVDGNITWIHQTHTYVEGNITSIHKTHTYVDDNITWIHQTYTYVDGSITWMSQHIKEHQTHTYVDGNITWMSQQGCYSDSWLYQFIDVSNTLVHQTGFHWSTYTHPRKWAFNFIFPLYTIL